MSNRAISTELIELGERIRKRRQEMKLSQESVQEVLCRIQKMEWKEQKIIMQTIDSLIDSFNEYR